VEVGAKRWKVETNSKQDAVLLLSSINLPGGILRRKSENDELQMRNFFVEGDILSAEVQTFYADGSFGIHTRSLKYGKLGNGTLVIVPPALIRRSKSHFYTLACKVHVILGVNGYVWVGKERIFTEEDSEDLYSNSFEPISKDERLTIARVVNCINALSKEFCFIDETILNLTYEISLGYKLKEMLQEEAIESMVEQAKSQLL
jgi:exosome complex component RRP4